MRAYNKSDLERIVSVQLENLDAMHDLLKIMKFQNELLNTANIKLKDEISEVKDKLIKYSTKKVKQTKEIPKRK